MDKTDVIINAIKKVKKNIKDKIKIKLDDSYTLDEKKIKNFGMEHLGSKVKITIENVKHKKEDKIKLLIMEINNEKSKQFPNKELIKELEDKIKIL